MVTEDVIIQDILVASIILDGGTCTRKSLDTKLGKEAVQEYERLYSTLSEEDIPPVVVFEEDGRHYLSDGFLRIEALKKLGRKTTRAVVRQGTPREAYFYAVAANKQGKRARGDKKDIVTAFLKDSQFVSLMDKEIADKCGVTPGYVSSIRKGLGEKTGLVLLKNLREKKSSTVTYPANGLQFASMAILDLEKITDQDTERMDAFKKVFKWLAINTSLEESMALLKHVYNTTE